MIERLVAIAVTPWWFMSFTGWAFFSTVGLATVHLEDALR